MKTIDALKILNKYISNGEIKSADINQIEVLIAIRTLDEYKEELYLDKGGKLCLD